VDLAGEQVGQQRRLAAIGDVRHRQPRLLRQQEGEGVARRTRPEGWASERATDGGDAAVRFG
jgi:hypothetical protein